MSDRERSGGLGIAGGFRLEVFPDPHARQRRWSDAVVLGEFGKGFAIALIEAEDEIFCKLTLFCPLLLLGDLLSKLAADSNLDRCKAVLEISGMVRIPSLGFFLVRVERGNVAKRSGKRSIAITRPAPSI